MPLAEVPVNCSSRLGDECECKSDPWHRVLLPVLCYTAKRLLQLQNTSDPWHSVQLLVLCVYLLEWLWSSRFSCRQYFWKYHWTASTVESAVLPLTNCTLWQAMQICTRVQQFCIRLNSSRIHSSNNHIATCAASFIPLRSFQLQVQCAISFLSLAFNTLSALSIPYAAQSACTCSSSYHTSNLRI